MKKEVYILVLFSLTLILISGCAQDNFEPINKEDVKDPDRLIRRGDGGHDRKDSDVVIDVNNKADLPVLENIGFNLDYYDPKTNMAGDISFIKTIPHFNNKIFLEFGQELTGPGGTDVLPHPTYFLPIGTEVISAVKGEVSGIRYQERGDDYELSVTPENYPGWRITFDHVINPKVKVGDKVEAGDALAQVAYLESPGFPPELGWVELQVWKEARGSPPAICPFLLLNKDIKAEIENKIIQLAEDWEEFIGEDVYDQEKWIAPGCLIDIAGT